MNMKSLPGQASRLAGSMAALMLLLAPVAAPVQAAEFPTKEVRIIVPFPAGGGSDTVSRLVGERLSERLKRPVIIENKAGAGGMIGTRTGAQAAPDAHTLTTITFNFLTAPSMFKDPGFDPVKDFDAVTLIANFPMVLVVGPSVKAADFTELVRDIKKDPKSFSIGSSSPGGGGHLSGELFRQKMGGDIMSLPYKGAAPLNVDLIGGRISMSFAHITSIIEQIKGGRVRALAITSAQRSPLLPDVPTMVEMGYPDFVTGEIVGLVTSTGAPKASVAKLYGEIAEILKSGSEARTRLERQGAEVVANTPEDFGSYIREQSRKWSAVVKEAGLEQQQ